MLATAEEVEVSSFWVVKAFHQAAIAKLLAANSEMVENKPTWPQ